MRTLCKMRMTKQWPYTVRQLVCFLGSSYELNLFYFLNVAVMDIWESLSDVAPVIQIAFAKLVYRDGVHEDTSVQTGWTGNTLSISVSFSVMTLFYLLFFWTATWSSSRFEQLAFFFPSCSFDAQILNVLPSQFFMQAKSICPSDPLVYNELGVVAYHSKQYESLSWLYYSHS